MKESAGRGKSFLGMGVLFFIMIFAMSIFTICDRTVPVQAAVVKKKQTEKTASSKTEDKWKNLLKKYESDKKVKQLIFVKYKGHSRADVILYKKTDGKFKKVLSCSGYVGKYGINKKREGDKRTPTGTYGFSKAFGIKNNPGTKIKYTKLNPYLYWSADRKYYNQMIDIRKVKASRAGEHLIRYRPHYNYALAIDYNKKCVYKKGAAIFLHCTGRNPYTAGCVAVKETYMKKIIKTVDENAKICIYPK